MKPVPSPASIVSSGEPNSFSLEIVGPLLVHAGTSSVSVSTGKRAIIAALALSHPRSCSWEDLAELVWDTPPGSPRKAIQNQIRRLRVEVGPGFITTDGDRYRLGDGVAIIDRDRLRAAASGLDATTSIDHIDDILVSWRGIPYEELPLTDRVWQERGRLLTHRNDLLEWFVERCIELGQFDRARAAVPAELVATSGRESIGILATRIERLHSNDPIETSSPTARRSLSSGQNQTLDRMLEITNAGARTLSTSAIMLSGAAGTGKTTMLRSLIERLADTTKCAETSCAESPVEPKEALVHLRDSVFEVLGGETPGGVTIEDQLVDLLSRDDHPHVALVIDDAHWATLSMMGFIRRIPMDCRNATVIIATRSENSEDLQASFDLTVLSTSPLDYCAIENQLQAVINEGNLDHQVPADQLDEADMTALVNELHFLTSGHPLFVTQVLADLVDSNALLFSDGQWVISRDHQAPKSIRETILGRLNRLSLGSRHFVEALAVLELAGGVDIVAEFAAVADDQISATINSGLVVDRDGRYSTAHATISQVIFEALPEGTRAELHYRAVGFLAERSPIPAARHAILCPQVSDAEKQQLTRAAAQLATDRFDHETAVEMWHYLVNTNLGSGERVDAQIQLMESARRSGDPRQLGWIREAVELATALGDGDRMAVAAIAMCRLGLTSDVNPSSEFVEFTNRALDVVVDPRLRIQLLGASTQLHALGPDDDKLIRVRFDEALGSARAMGDEELERLVLPAAFMSVVDPEDLDLREELGRRLLDLSVKAADQDGQYEAHDLLYSVGLIRGIRAEAEHHHEEMTKLDDALREPPKRWTMSYHECLQLYLAGDLEQAEQWLDRSLELGRAVGQDRNLAVYAAQVLALRWDQGRLSELTPLVDSLLDSQPGMAVWVIGAAFVAYETGDHERANELMDLLSASRFETLPRDTTWTAAIWSLGRIAAGLRREADSILLRDLLTPLSGQMCWTASTTYGPVDLPLGDLEASLGNTEIARKYLSAAQELGHSQRWPTIELRANLSLAEYCLPFAERQVLLRSTYTRATQIGLIGIAKEARSLRGS